MARSRHHGAFGSRGRVWHRHARLLGTDGPEHAQQLLWRGPGIDGIEYVYVESDDTTPIRIATLQSDGRVLVEVLDPLIALDASHSWILDALEQAFPSRTTSIGY